MNPRSGILFQNEYYIKLINKILIKLFQKNGMQKNGSQRE